MSRSDVHEETPTRRETDRWHLGKEIPVVLILAVLAQTAGGIWWMAQLSAKIDAAVSTISEFRSERYTREDARRDVALIEQKIASQQNRDAELDRRITQLEGRLDIIRGMK